MKNTAKSTQTRRAYFLNADGSKQWFDIPNDTAEKVLRLQKMFKKEDK
jgi:hypothetical protein